MGFSSSEKAAVILSLLGHELAGQIFSALGRSEQAKIIRSLTTDRRLSEQEVNEICEDFIKKSAAAVTGLRPTDHLRLTCFAGIELPRPSSIDEICEEIPDWILLDHLSTQMDSVASAVLGSMNASRAAKLFKEFPADRQVRLLLSLSKEKVLDTAALDELEADLEALKMKTSMGRYGQRVGGHARVLALMQELNSEMRGQILGQLGAQEPALAEFLEGGLLSVERLSQLLPSHLALLLGQIKDNDVGSFLRGETTQIQSVYLKCLSKRRREDVECLLAPDKKITQKQKAEASERLRQCAIQMKGEGKILFPWEESLVG